MQRRLTLHTGGTKQQIPASPAEMEPRPSLEIVSAQDRHGNEVIRVTAMGTRKCTIGGTEKICRPGALSAPEASAAKVCAVRRRSLTRPPLSTQTDCGAHAPACALQSGSTARPTRAVQAPRVHTRGTHTFQPPSIRARRNPRSRRRPPATGKIPQGKIVRPEGFEPPTF